MSHDRRPSRLDDFPLFQMNIPSVPTVTYRANALIARLAGKATLCHRVIYNEPSPRSSIQRLINVAQLSFLR